MKKNLIAIFLIFFSFQSHAFQKDETGLTALMQAVANNDVDSAKFFAKVKLDEINKQNIGGATALHIAARNNNSAIAEILLSHGADVNLRDNENYSAAMRAASYGHKEVLSLILQKNPNLTFKNSKNESLIILSANSSCDQCLSYVLSSIIPARNYRIDELKSQLEAAFSIAAWRENDYQKKMLMGFLDKLVDYEKSAASGISHQENKAKYVLKKAQEDEDEASQVEVITAKAVKDRVVQEEKMVSSKENKELGSLREFPRAVENQGKTREVSAKKSMEKQVDPIIYQFGGEKKKQSEILKSEALSLKKDESQNVAVAKDSQEESKKYILATPQEEMVHEEEINLDDGKYVFEGDQRSLDKYQEDRKKIAAIKRRAQQKARAAALAQKKAEEEAAAKAKAEAAAKIAQQEKERIEAAKMRAEVEAKARMAAEVVKANEAAEVGAAQNQVADGLAGVNQQVGSVVAGGNSANSVAGNSSAQNKPTNEVRNSVEPVNKADVPAAAKAVKAPAAPVAPPAPVIPPIPSVPSTPAAAQNNSSNAAQPAQESQAASSPNSAAQAMFDQLEQKKELPTTDEAEVEPVKEKGEKMPGDLGELLPVVVK